MKGLHQPGGLVAVAISLLVIGGVSATPPSELPDRADVADRLMPLFEAALRNRSMFENAGNAPHGIGRTHNPSSVLSAAKTVGEAVERFPIHPEIVKVVELQMRQGGVSWSDLDINRRHRLLDWTR